MALGKYQNPYGVRGGHYFRVDITLMSRLGANLQKTNDQDIDTITKHIKIHLVSHLDGCINIKHR